MSVDTHTSQGIFDSRPWTGKHAVIGRRMDDESISNCLKTLALDHHTAVYVGTGASDGQDDNEPYDKLDIKTELARLSAKSETEGEHE